MSLPSERIDRSYNSEPFTPREYLGLGPGEVILFMHPNYLVSAAIGTKIMEEYYTDPRSRKTAGINDYLRLFDRERVTQVTTPVITEYSGLLQTLVTAVGPQRVKLLSTSLQSLQDKRFDDLKGEVAHTVDANLKLSYPDIETVSLVGQTKKTFYPRDLFATYKTDRGQVTFVSPIFPASIESDTVIRSFFSESGMVLQAGNSMLISVEALNWLDKAPQIASDFELLESLGFKMRFIPKVKRETQQEKEAFAEGHIDGHAAFILGKDETPYLLLAQSYATQDIESQRKLVIAARTVGATSFSIDDTETNHLAFNNIIQFPDGTVLYAPSGKNESGRYKHTALDIAMLQLVEPDKLLFTGQLEYIPRVTSAGSRCTTSIVPWALLKALRTN